MTWRKVDGRTRRVAIGGALTVSLSLATCLTRAQGGGAYGGHAQIRGDATGVFRLEKCDGRWLFYTPDGYGFVPLGISGMHAQQAQWNGALKDGSSHRDSCLRKFGTVDRWKTDTARRIRDWGFNYTGCFSYTTLESEGVPYILTLSLTKYAIDERGPVCGNIWYGLGNNYLCPDLWHPDLPAFMEERFLKATAPRRSVDDPLLLFYYPDEMDQLKGFANYADHPGWAALVGDERIGCTAAAGKTGKPTLFDNHTKHRLVSFVRERYGNNVELLNAAWGVTFKAFDDILAVRRDDATWGRGRDPGRAGFPRFREDLDAFLGLVGERYVRLVKETIRRHDTRHLIGWQVYGTHPRWPLWDGVAEAGHFDFYMVTWDAADYVRIGRPFMRLLYPSACNDSPLRFAGTCASWRLCSDARGTVPVPAGHSPSKDERLYLRIEDPAVDYWFELKFAAGRLPVLFEGVPVSRSSVTTPWHFQVLYTGRPAGGPSWFTVRSQDPFSCGRAWELKDGLDSLRAAGGSATYRRSTAIPESDFRSQEERGRWWATQIAEIADAKAANGDRFVVGAEWWKYMDNGWTYWVEQVNWGLVTLRDNTYDGKEATRVGADGKPGTWDDEADDYGDCITEVRKANRGIYGRLLGAQETEFVPTIDEP